MKRLTFSFAHTGHGTDNSANLTLSNGTATPGRAKHALRRWAAIRERVASGVCRIVKIDTDSMPVDFMTKHKGRKMIDASVAYLTNSRNRVETDTADVEGAGVPVDRGIKMKPEVSMLEVSALEVSAIGEEDTFIDNGLYATGNTPCVCVGWKEGEYVEVSMNGCATGTIKVPLMERTVHWVSLPLFALKPSRERDRRQRPGAR